MGHNIEKTRFILKKKNIKLHQRQQQCSPHQNLTTTQLIFFFFWLFFHPYVWSSVVHFEVPLINKSYSKSQIRSAMFRFVSFRCRSEVENVASIGVSSANTGRETINFLAFAIADTHALGNAKSVKS